MTSKSEELAERIDEAVLAVTGVQRIYRPGPLAAVLRDAGAALGIGADSVPAVRLTIRGTRVVVEASIGIDGSQRAADVLARVRAAVADALEREDFALENVALTIAHVHPHEAAQL